MPRTSSDIGIRSPAGLEGPRQAFIDKHREVWQALGVLYLYLLVEGPVSVGCGFMSVVDAHVVLPSLVTFAATTSCHVHALISSRVTSSPRPSPPRTFVDRSAVANRHHIATSAHLSPSVPPPLHIRPVTLLAQAVDSFLPPSRFAPYLDACPRFPRACPRATLLPRIYISLRVPWQR